MLNRKASTSIIRVHVNKLTQHHRTEGPSVNKDKACPTG